jgi:hypothetical protein
VEDNDLKRRYLTRTGASAALIIVFTAFSAAWAPIVTSATAQEVIRRVPAPRWSLFDIFTPRRERVRPKVDAPEAPRANRQKPAATAAKPRKPKSRVVAKTTETTVGLATAANASAAAATETLPVEKRPDARTVLVIGDFMAGGLSEALTQTFDQNANIRVLDRTQGSSGFVRQDVYDWATEISNLIETDKPAAVVVMMGSNDRQPMRIAGEAEPPRSDAWMKEYQARTTALAETLEAGKVPFLWVSVPAFKSPKMTSDMLAFNTIYKGSAEGGGGEFVDIWDGFVDENGNFVTSGPDVNGQPVRLRGRDGINLTDAGKAKVAFYVEKPLRKILGETDDGTKPAITAPSLPQGPKLPVAVDRTEPIALDDPSLDGGSDLMGGPAAGAALPGDPVAAAPAPEGRADAFQPQPSPTGAQAERAVEPEDTALRLPVTQPQ